MLSTPLSVQRHGCITSPPPPTSNSTVSASPAPPASAAQSIRSSEQIALEESHNQQRQVDPFRIGYNMGMQNIHLETLRNKLDDNLELLKSHFNSLREAQRNNHEALRAMQVEYNKQTRKQFDDGVEGLRERMEHVSQRMGANEDMLRELSKQQFESLQKHVDDRLENIKDTIKLSIGILFALNLWILFLVNQSLAHGSAAAQQQQQRHQTAVLQQQQQSHPLHVAPTQQQLASKHVTGDAQPHSSAAPDGENKKKRGWFS